MRVNRTGIACKMRLFTCGEELQSKWKLSGPLISQGSRVQGSLGKLQLVNVKNVKKNIFWLNILLIGDRWLSEDPLFSGKS